MPLALLVALQAGHAVAQDTWPSTTIKIIVPSSPGGGTDVYARILAFGLTDSLKQQVVVDNRPGGNAMIGAQAVAQSAPDGYTIMVSASPALLLNPVIFKKLPYDPDKDFAPVSAGVISPLVFVVHPSVPARTLAELVAIGRKEPGKLNFGSAQITSTPSPIAHRLNEEINRLMKAPAIAEKLEAHVLIPVFGAPAEFAARLKSQRAMWTDIIAKIGFKVE